MATMQSYFFSCDWGTSSFRLRLVETTTGRVAGERRSAEGAKSIAAAHPAEVERAQAFQQLLTHHVDALISETGILPDTIIISGMASSSIGWQPLPYAPLPVNISGDGLGWALLDPQQLSDRHHQMTVYLVSGLSSATDIMRGEEVEIIGVLSDPAYAAFRESAVLILPGTHAKHVRIEDKKITAISTYMTGELYALLTEQSILRFTAFTEANSPDGHDDFAQGVRDAQTGQLTSLLFQVRTRSLLHELPPARNLAYLNGLLVGAEVRGLLAGSPDNIPVLLCAGPRHASVYTQAFTALGQAQRVTAVLPEVMDRATVLGHRAIVPHLTQGAIA
ncbi:MAG TPA: 2-dehydro-3-deoxygalactonokinase [Armatimonadota bacterium]|nr:2-dehydro-3-deoxygalactonokinase [Armatimonadota bacterium]